jgi:hypothetical protein
VLWRADGNHLADLRGRVSGCAAGLGHPRCRLAEVIRFQQLSAGTAGVWYSAMEAGVSGSRALARLTGMPARGWLQNGSPGPVGCVKLHLLVVVSNVAGQYVFPEVAFRVTPYGVDMGA